MLQYSVFTQWSLKIGGIIADFSSYGSVETMNSGGTYLLPANSIMIYVVLHGLCVGRVIA